MLTKKGEFPRICHQLVRNLSERRKNRGGTKPYATAKKDTKQYSYPFDMEFNHQTGVSWDKMIGNEEVKLLSYMANHREQTTPTVITDRVHDVSEVLPGVSVGPKFFDHEAGDTLARGNEEAAKINNFLHLSPPMIKMHTAELAKLCKPPPPKPTHCLRQYTTNYVYPGPSIKHPLSREASLRVRIKDLELDHDTEEHFRELVTANQNMKLKDLHPKTYEHYRLPKIFRDLPVLLELADDVLTIHAKQCPTRKQNLSLCYYRLSGFIQEAGDLKPVYKDLNLGKLVTEFVFDQDEAKISRFQEKNFVQLHRSKDGCVTGITGSAESISLAVNLIEEVSGDVVAELFEIPEPYTWYFMDHCKKFKEILSTHEAIYSDNNIVTFSDSLQNVKDDLTTLLSELTHFTIPCPAHISQFVLTDRFVEGLSLDYDALVTAGEACVEVTVRHAYRDRITSLITDQVKASEESTETEDILCPQDINWDKLSRQFNAHVTVSEDKIRVTASSTTIKEISFFVKRRETFVHSLT